MSATIKLTKNQQQALEQVRTYGVTWVRKSDRTILKTYNALVDKGLLVVTDTPDTHIGFGLPDRA